MPKSIIQYRVFIASPGGLDEERRAFRKTVDEYSKREARPRGVLFEPFGWEDTLPGRGRPQHLINAEIEQSDYVVFILHDRWGSPTGSGYSSGFEEEWELAKRLYAEVKVFNMPLLFKKVDEARLADPGDQLKQVLTFKKTIEEGKRDHYRPFDDVEAFCGCLEDLLAHGCEITRVRQAVRD
jgi:hypothetical protein